MEISLKKQQKMAKILVIEIKRCLKLHLTVAQPQLVFNLFLTFDPFCGLCSYKIVPIKKNVVEFCR